MTREPFIAHSELTHEIYIVSGRNKYRVTEQAINAVKAIKGLEQEPVLDKLRAEVENINVWGMRYEPDTYLDQRPQIVQKVKEHVIEIIDKYKTESEG